MIFVDRQRINEPPSLLNQGKAERIAAIAHYAAASPPQESFPHKAYKRQDVKDALNDLFAGKCAYCESLIQNHPMDIEHYRPKNAVVIKENGSLKLKKPGYYWLGADWDNLLPSCIDCNRRREQELPDGQSDKLGKANLFPIRDELKRVAGPDHPLEDEEPLLLHPCHGDLRPEEHLEFLGEGLVRQASIEGVESEHGRVTIDVCGLQRMGLVTARRAHYLLLLERFETLFFLRDQIIANVDDAANVSLLKERFATKLRLLNKMVEPGEPFAGMTRQLLPKLKAMHKQGLSWAQALNELDPGPDVATAGQV